MPQTIQEPGGALRLVFGYAFRPFFLLVAVHALLVVPLWTAWWTGTAAFALAGNPIYVHAHEMLSGFAGAAIAGFLLTAVATWTRRPPVSGILLALLCALWLGARLSLQAPLAYALLDLAWWLGLLGLMAREVVAAGNRRNYKILGILALLTLADQGFHAASLLRPDLERQAVWGQLWLVILLIAVIGGRIIPAFTANWLRRRAEGAALPPESLPPAFGRIDLAAIVLLVLFAVCTLVGAPAVLSVSTGALAALLHAWRLARWKGQLTLSDPLVWMLHLSYAWIPLGLALMTLAEAGLLAPSAALHALGVGAIAGMIVSVSSRAALGHTNRPLRSHPLLTGAIILLALAALLRIAAAVTPSSALLGASSLAWLAAFVCYGLRYAPILLRPPA